MCGNGGVELMSRRASSQRRRAHRYPPFATKLRLAEVPQIDHRVGDGFERVVQFADALETKQQSLELVFPAEDPLNGVESLLEKGGIKHWFGSALWGNRTFNSICHGLRRLINQIVSVGVRGGVKFV